MKPPLGNSGKNGLAGRQCICILYTGCGILNGAWEKIKGKFQGNFIRIGTEPSNLLRGKFDYHLT